GPPDAVGPLPVVDFGAFEQEFVHEHQFVGRDWCFGLEAQVEDAPARFENGDRRAEARDAVASTADAGTADFEETVTTQLGLLGLREASAQECVDAPGGGPTPTQPPENHGRSLSVTTARSRL